MTNSEQQERIDVFVGVDVGEGTHHAVALDLAGSVSAEVKVTHLGEDDGFLSRRDVGVNPIDWTTG